MSQKLRDIPALPTNLDPQLKAVLDQWREALQKIIGTRGADRAARVSDMQAWGYLDGRGNSTGGSGGTGSGDGDGGSEYEPDLTPPPVSTTLTVTAAVTSLLVEWETPIYLAGHGHGQTNIYGAQWPDGATEPIFADASRIGSAGGALTIYAHPTNPNTRWCIWIRWESRDGVEGPIKGGLHGVQATTGKIGNAQLAALAVQAAQLAEGAVDLQSGSVKSDGAFGALAVGYTVTRYLLATSGLMENLVVDNAQIANLSVAKLIGGSLAVGAHIQSTNYVAGVSGWIDRSDGYSERNNTVVRGTVFASAGAIGGSFIGSNYIMSTNWVSGSTGWRWNNDGTGWIGGIYMDLDLIRSVNYVLNTAGFALRADGTGQIGGLKITTISIESSNFVAGVSGIQIKFDGSVEIYNLTARGNITAKHLDSATGTFSGTMTATAVNAVNTVNIAGNAVTVPVGVEWSGTAAGNTNTWVAGTPGGDFAGGAVIIIGAIMLRGGGGGNAGQVRMNIFRNGAQIRALSGGPLVPVAGQGALCYAFVDYPGPGVHSYQIGGVINGQNSTLTNATLACLGAKR
ncbi:MAG: hypothetical protein WAQ08_16150 [Aquabacterium sp.]|uniref:hypothetical protein n=1 Tax=Aquabacterium sp. TaxID=1872578 RepID=UPI003BAF6F29